MKQMLRQVYFVLFFLSGFKLPHDDSGESFLSVGSADEGDKIW